jgi:hypothetical protein
VAEIIINSDRALADAIGYLREAFGRSKFLRMIVREKVRSLNQNDQAHVWYEQVSLELREDTPLGVKCTSKLNVGVPIMRAIDSDFRAFYDKVLKPRPYEDKIEAMKYMPVTSLMPVDAASQYLTDLQAFWGKRGGVKLEFLNPKTNR